MAAQQTNSADPKKKVDNFLAQYRDQETRKLTNFTAQQFLEVWKHYDDDGNGYIEGEELEGFLREFITSVIPEGDIGSEVISDAALQDLKEEFMLAYDENEDNRIEIGELAEMLPTDENFLLLFHRDNPLESSVDFMRIWKKFDTDNSGYIESEELNNFLKYLLERSDVVLPDEKINEYAQTILKLFDENGDGKLQLSEMSRLLPVKENFLSRPLFKNASRLNGNDIDRIFLKYDTDKNGTIENEELDGLLKDLLELMGEKYDEEKMKFFRNVILEQWDVDNDGTIGRNELKMILLQHSRMAQEDDTNAIYGAGSDDDDDDY